MFLLPIDLVSWIQISKLSKTIERGFFYYSPIILYFYSTDLLTNSSLILQLFVELSMLAKEALERKAMTVTASAKKMPLVHLVLKQFPMLLYLSAHSSLGSQIVVHFQIHIMTLLMKTRG